MLISYEKEVKILKQKVNVTIEIELIKHNDDGGGTVLFVRVVPDDLNVDPVTHHEHEFEMTDPMEVMMYIVEQNLEEKLIKELTDNVKGIVNFFTKKAPKD